MCIVCEQPLFTSDTKYDSSCGWPAFNDVLDQGKVKLTPDTSGGRFFSLNCLFFVVSFTKDVLINFTYNLLIIHIHIIYNLGVWFWVLYLCLMDCEIITCLINFV